MTQRNWTKVGADHDRGLVEKAILSLQWREIPKDGSIELPMMPGEGIKAAVKELRIPKVSHIAWSSEMAPFGFYGIRGHYKNGDAEIYIVDEGTHLSPVCTDFHEKGETPLFKESDIVSTYTDGEACEDGTLVAINPKDRVTRAVWEYLARYTPMDSQPPANWPVEMMGWFRAGSIGQAEAAKMIAKHGLEAQKKFEQQVRDNKAKALSGGLISREGRRARDVYEQNIDGGIHALWAKQTDGRLTELSTSPNGGDKFWLLPNENNGITLMFPEDY